MATYNSINISDKVICKRSKREDDRFDHEYHGLVIKKYKHSALVIITICHQDDDAALLTAHGKTIVPYKNMEKLGW